jgi:hypothetical protein
VREAVLEAVGGPVASTTIRRDTCTERRVLLVDEVDVLQSETFLGHVFTPVARYTSAPLTKLMKHIYESRADDTALRAIETGPLFRDVTAAAPDLETFMQGQLKLMLHQVRDFGASTRLHDPSRPYDYVVDRHRGVGYYDTDGTINFRFTPDQGSWYRAAFALLREQQLGNVVGDKEQRLSLPLACPSFSYAELPQRYCAVFAVTGTIRTLATDSRQYLETKCNVKHRTYAESIQPSLRFSVKKKLTDESTWHDAIEAAVTDAMRALSSAAHAPTDETYPCVVVFESTAAIHAFLAAKPRFVDLCRIISRNTPLNEVQRLVDAATEGNTLTLIDRPFGRGTDFKCKRCTQLTVIMTFLPPTISEEIQICGRTGRQGQPGCVSMVLCVEHVVKMLQPPLRYAQRQLAHKTSMIASRSGQTTSRPLRAPTACSSNATERDSKRIHSHAVTAISPSCALWIASGDSFANRILSTDLSAAEKRALVLEVCLPATNEVYLLLLDGSRSMACGYEGWTGSVASAVCGFFGFTGDNNARWTGVKHAFSETAMRLSSTMPDSYVIAEMFGRNGTSREIFAGPARNLPPHVLDCYQPDLETEYYEAFDTAHQSLKRDHVRVANRPLRILFLSDGDDNPISGRIAADAVKRLCGQHRVNSFHCLMVNQKVTTAITTIMATFKEHGAYVAAHSISNTSEMLAAFHSVFTAGASCY